MSRAQLDVGWSRIAQVEMIAGDSILFHACHPPAYESGHVDGIGAKRESEPLCESDFHASWLTSCWLMPQGPKHATYLRPKSRVDEELGPPMPSVCRIWLHLIPSSLLCLWISLCNFRSIDFWHCHYSAVYSWLKGPQAIYFLSVYLNT